MNVLVLAGEGRYADPWHPFRDTSESIAAILRADGHTVEVDGRVDERLADLAGVDLLVVNIGDSTLDPANHDEEADALSRAGLLQYVGSGRPILAFHTSTASLRGIPEWESVVGGVWIRGVSMHPPAGIAELELHHREHPVLAGIDELRVFDERYSYQRVSPAVEVLADHEHDGIMHPVIWANTGASRVVYDALGHNARSFESAAHARLVRNAANWLLE
jgi:type 1 glutamine amidotransferase